MLLKWKIIDRYRADLLLNLRRLNIETLNSIINTFILFFVTKFYFINIETIFFINLIYMIETIFFINLILINAVLSSNLRFKINNLIVFNDMILVFYFYL
jgi:hypothetical protein